jgi:transcriptional regulator with XRE-family HTH domain
MTAQTSQVSLSEQVAEEIRAMLARQRMTQRAMAQELGVSVPWVNYRLTGNQEIGLNDLERMAGVLNVGVSELLPMSLRGVASAGSAA